MIAFVKKADLQPLAKEDDGNRFEQIRRVAAQMHKKSDADLARRRDRRRAEDSPLI